MSPIALKKVISPEEINKNIFVALKSLEMPDSEKVALLDKMSQLVESRLALRLMKSVSEDDAKRIENMDDAKRADFMAEKLPNLDKLLQEEIIRVKTEVLVDIHSDENLIAL